MSLSMPRINVDSPLWDQNTFTGRFRHFYWLTNPLNCLAGEAELRRSQALVAQYRLGEEPKGTTTAELHRAMQLTASSFHPDSGELQNVFGRMSFQAPGGMIITGAMLQFYKSVPQVVFWQWFNQSFNALVNFTNRNANSPISEKQLGIAYVSATFSALAAAIGLKRVLEKNAPKMMQRFVPLVAVGSANCVNLPLMRQTEILEGVDLRDDKGNLLCKSMYAAKKGIAQVVASRNAIMAPGMLTMPFVMRAMEQRPWFKNNKMAHMPFQVGAIGVFLTVMVPAGCAMFPQNCEVEVAKLKEIEPTAYDQVRAKFEREEDMPKKLYFNKGL